MLVGLVAVVVLGLLIVVHEFGHFLVAKRLGVGVLKFSVGFGPKLFGRTVNGTEYALSVIPLGGYVKMVGEDDTDGAGDEVDPRLSFSHQELWKRMAIVTAGPAFNLLFALVAFIAVFAVYGIQVPSEAARIGGVMDGTPAARAGLQLGDLVTRVDGEPITTWKQLSTAIRASGGREVELTLQNDGAVRTVRVQAEERPEKDPLSGEVLGKAYLIGIAPDAEREPVGLGTAVKEGTLTTGFWIKTTFVNLVKLVQGRISREDIGGPIAIIQGAKQQAKAGMEYLLQFMALISINLGVLNLLPIPILDGGHILFFSLEAVLRRPLNVRHREIAQQVGLVLLLCLMAFAFYNDIARMVRNWG